MGCLLPFILSFILLNYGVEGRQRPIIVETEEFDSIDCAVGEWLPWTACSASCYPGGKKIRIRGITTRPSGDGQPCPALKEDTLCNEDIGCPRLGRSVVDSVEEAPSRFDSATAGTPCTNKLDGHYATAPCASEYYSCVAGLFIPQKCPGALVFDPSSQRCDMPFNTEGCTGTSRTTTTTTTPEPIMRSAIVTFDCSKRANGFYANPAANNSCDHIYFACTNGLTAVQQCPASLYFDEEIQSCQLHAYIPNCSGNERTTISQATPQLRALFNLTTIPMNTEQNFPIDCKGLADGNYADPLGQPINCSKIYYSCYDGKTSRKLCQSDLYYDQSRNICDFRGRVAECTANNTFRSGELCTEIMDGFYPDETNPCSSNFYECKNGVMTKGQCSNGYIFDVQTSTCKPPNEMKDACLTPTSDFSTTTTSATANPTNGCSNECTSRTTMTTSGDYGSKTSSSQQTTSGNMTITTEYPTSTTTNNGNVTDTSTKTTEFSTTTTTDNGNETITFPTTTSQFSTSMTTENGNVTITFPTTTTQFSTSTTTENGNVTITFPTTTTQFSTSTTTEIGNVTITTPTTTTQLSTSTSTENGNVTITTPTSTTTQFSTFSTTENGNVTVTIPTTTTANISTSTTTEMSDVTVTTPTMTTEDGNVTVTAPTMTTENGNVTVTTSTMTTGNGYMTVTTPTTTSVSSTSTTTDSGNVTVTTPTTTSASSTSTTTDSGNVTVTTPTLTTEFPSSTTTENGNVTVTATTNTTEFPYCCTSTDGMNTTTTTSTTNVSTVTTPNTTETTSSSFITSTSTMTTGQTESTSPQTQTSEQSTKTTSAYGTSGTSSTNDYQTTKVYKRKFFRSRKKNPKSPVDCEVVGDGLHPDPKEDCSKVFYYCNKGSSLRVVCPEDMFYNAEKSTCAEFEDVPACVAAVKNGENNIGWRLTNAAAMCANAPDGKYGNPLTPCSNLYIVCSKGTASIGACQKGLYFNPKLRKCDTRSNILACVEGRNIGKLNCNALDDGLYSTPFMIIDDRFLLCSGGMEYEQACPVDMKFDQTARQCKNGAGTSVSSQSCLSLPKGDYANPEFDCSTYYYKCNGQPVATLEMCRGATVFNQENGKCEKPTLVKDCQNFRLKRNFETKLSTPLKRPKRSSSCSYEGRRYPVPDLRCAQFYYECVDGRMRPIACPDHARYNPVTEMCQNANDVYECMDGEPQW